MKKGAIILTSIILAVVMLAVSFISGVMAGGVIVPQLTQAAASYIPALSQISNLVGLGNVESIVQASVLGKTPSDKATPVNRELLFMPFWEAWGIVHDQYIDQPVDDVQLMYGAIRGMVEALGDEHTSYMDPEQYKAMNMEMEGEYEGIGAWVDPTAEYLTIISPMEGSPAEKAGLMAGDQILAIDGKDMTGIDGNLVIKRVMGPAGSKVVLTVRRKDENKPFDVTVVRAKVVVPSVEGKMLEDDIAYVQLSTFGENTERDLRQNLKDLLAKKPVGMILDLRNNGGGFLITAIEVASEFIDQGVVLYEDYGNGKKESYKVRTNGLATDIPLVVLINEGSASASEIVAGAIRDHDRGRLVGMTSFGKGSVQNWVPLKGDQGAVRVTIARWLTPNGDQINKKGLKPDVEIQFTEEDIKAQKDVQLEQAIKTLKDEIK
jgi:carboxyl-terminal processing protease